jgi:hypothetical protein
LQTEKVLKVLVLQRAGAGIKIVAEKEGDRRG